MAGISMLTASGTKPQGLNSGESQRVFDQIQQDRFAALAKRYQNIYPELAYMYLNVAEDIAKQEGSYLTIYPGKDGTREIDLKNLKGLTDNPIIQCFEESSLPKDPAGRQAKLSEMLAAQEITPQEFRRLSNFPDLQQDDRLAAALEERILYCLDDIVEHGDKNFDKIAPDNFMLDPTDMASAKCTNYINLYSTLNLEESKLQALRDWFTQVQNLKQQANPPPVQQAPAGQAGPLPVAPPQQSIAPTSNVQV